MDPSAIAPTRVAREAFKNCWSDLDKLYNWHKLYTPWVSDEVIKEFIQDYKKQIQTQNSQSENKILTE